MPIEKCSFCSSTNLGLGYQMGNGQIYPDIYAYHSTQSGSVVEYIICKDCGCIVCARVRNPELFSSYNTARQGELLEYIDRHGIILCIENIDLPSLCGLGYNMENIIALIEQKKVFYCKAFKKCSTYLSVQAYQHLNRCFLKKPLTADAENILTAMKDKSVVDKDEMRLMLAMEKKPFDRAFDLLLENLYITAIGGKRLNPNWYSYLYCTAETWKHGVAGLHFNGGSKDALWKIVGKNMDKKDFDIFTKNVV